MQPHLVLDLPKQFLLSHVVDPQGLPHTGDQSPLESHDRQRYVIRFRLVQQFQPSTPVREGVRPQKPART